MLRKITLIFLLLTQILFARWGWGSHRFINNAAVDHLPAEMSFFQDHRDFLSEHSVDPDTDSDPGYYHYIDIDDYPEFFTGELPHEWQAMMDMYGQSRVEDNGIVPWVIEWWMEDLKNLMEAGEWDDVWQVAAELGHYVADSHQALHLTLNYNGQLTGNYGIHSRYETNMMNPRLDQIVFEDSIAGYWTTPMDSIFSYIGAIYPIVDLVMAADDAAHDVDPGYGTTYYNMMWQALGDTTIWTLERAALDLASIWYTCWVDAGSPYPAGLNVDESYLSPQMFRLSSFPNPFNGLTTIQFQLDKPEHLSINIMDIRGQNIKQLAHGDFDAGDFSISWDGKNMNDEPVHSGVYLIQIMGAYSNAVHKITMIK